MLNSEIVEELMEQQWLKIVNYENCNLLPSTFNFIILFRFQMEMLHQEVEEKMEIMLTHIVHHRGCCPYYHSWSSVKWPLSLRW